MLVWLLTRTLPDGCGHTTQGGGRTVALLTMIWRAGVEIDIVRVEAVEVEELGIGQEVQVCLADMEGIGDIVGRRDVVEVGEVLRHVRCTTAIIRRHAEQSFDFK